MSDHHGLPCWYELTTGDLDAAQTFYAGLFGWSWTNAGMQGFDYRLASMGGAMVAGASAGTGDGAPPAWLTYFAVTDCDATAKAVADAGGAVHMPPADIPGTGRFAILADPQGAAFGILQPLPMEGGPPAGGAFDQQKTGHGNWHDLMTTDPKAALDFYGKLFGWTESRADEIGPGMVYHVFARGGVDIGGMYAIAPGMPGPGRPFWLAYFGAPSVTDAIARVTAAGGKVFNGPHEVPGGAFISIMADPQGAMLAVVGPK